MLTCSVGNSTVCCYVLVFNISCDTNAFEENLYIFIKFSKNKMVG